MNTINSSARLQPSSTAQMRQLVMAAFGLLAERIAPEASDAAAEVTELWLEPSLPRYNGSDDPEDLGFQFVDRLRRAGL